MAHKAHKENRRVLILGGTGMLGHKAYQIISQEFDTWVTFRRYNSNFNKLGIFHESKIIDGVDAFSFNTVESAIKSVRPHIILNCIGIIKQLKDAKCPKTSIYINSLLPHLLAETCQSNNIRLIHISTDCVFSGKRGNYQEIDISDAEDLYGRSKYLGEVNYPPGLTLRTSIIGHELNSKVSLIDWFLSNKGGRVFGYEKAFYTGLSTVAFSKEIVRIIMDFPTLSGLYHVSSERISKLELLKLINKIYNCHVLIEPDKHFFCDRSLNSEKYRSLTGFIPENWDIMIKEMYEDYKTTNYKEERAL